ncbi:MAG: tol-pal system-associated acyl-CoA thioesterase [Zoogloeaceae bacterium]|nr:tol-pal system-associated acyl-CoA thioesterase [Zoogloeaceae bacterium]
MNPESPALATFCLPVRVYYEDTDAAGVVYYASYFRFFERCRTEWLRTLGYGQAQLAAEENRVFVVKSASAEYHRPARLDDALAISLAVEKMGRSQVILRQEARRGDTVLVTGVVQVVCVNSEKMKAAAIPEALRKKLESCS